MPLLIALGEKIIFPLPILGSGLGLCDKRQINKRKAYTFI